VLGKHSLDIGLANACCDSWNVKRMVHCFVVLMLFCSETYLYKIKKCIQFFLTITKLYCFVLFCFVLFCFVFI
jgi:hypothetical protein